MNSTNTSALKVLKLWARSGSFEFAKASLSGPQGKGISSFPWNERPVHFRPFTGDADLINRILLKTGSKAEYIFPKDLEPKTVLDIGANIGATTLLLRKCYPEATIYAFEPHPENFKVLQKNTLGDSNIRAFEYALGSADEELDLILEDDYKNLGGFSLKSFGKEIKASTKVQVKNAGEFLNSLHVSQVDLIKIDTEGAEKEILFSLPKEILSKVQWICGELHGGNGGNDDFELLHYLSQWFKIGIRKSWWSRLAHFEACRKDLVLEPF